ncbi:peptidase S9 [Verrucomicrobia bacterium SCGC AG-212-E04]|nr:peptidase S9 [Verrucomicrobia bacterium SCGC AG-212-E04]
MKKIPVAHSIFFRPVAVLSLVAAVSVLGAEIKPPATKGLSVRDLVKLERVSDPRVSPDGRFVAYQVRRTDLDANKGINGIWLLDLKTPAAAPRMLSAPASEANSPRWSNDGKAIYFLSSRSGSTQVWRLALDGGEAQPVTQLPIDVGSFALSPDGRRLAVTLEVFADLGTLAETKKRLDEKAKPKSSGLLFDKLFIRHWDTWANGARSQLFTLPLDSAGLATGEPVLVSRGIDGDVPSKPFGDDNEYAFSPDGKTLYFNARIAGRTEAWSTNFDIFSAPADGSAAPRNLTPDNPAWDGYPLASPDGRKLYYLAMKRPGFESDRFGIMELDLASGKRREVAPNWDRSAGAMKISADGRTLYTNCDDLGQNRLFAIDVATGQAKALTDQGYVSGFAVSADGIVYAQTALNSPAQLFRLAAAAGAKPVPLTKHNAETVAGIAWGEFEQFSFRGAKDETVYGYVMKPAGFEPGKKYPVAFLIHGGPQGSFGNEFHYRWNPQIYAGAGYAVVFIDFHGSTGYGQKFTDSVSRDWGGAPLEDLKKGWAYALDKYPFLDGNRAAALGASYGGYMIAWIAGNWPDPWKCLVCHDGVFDSRLGSYSTEELWFDEWEVGGTQWDNPDAYEKFNPLNHVSKWKTPMLVVQGALDYRVGSEQAIGIFTALQRRGIPSEFLYFPDENHWVLKPQNSIQWHDTVLAWLNRWTAPAPKP